MQAQPTDAARGIAMQMSLTQEAFCTEEARFTAYVGGIGAGKTVAGSLKPLVMGYLDRPGTGLVIAPTYRMMADVSWRTALERWAPLIKRVRVMDNIIILHSGHEVMFRSADTPDRLRGPNVSWVWIDEAAMCHRDTWTIAIGRLREFGVAGRAWITTTPRGRNWVFDVFGPDPETGAPRPGTKLFRASTKSNPFVDEAFEASLRAQYSTDLARQELGGEFITMGGGMIDRRWFRIEDRYPPGLRWVRYWDLAASERTTADFTVGGAGAFDRYGDLWLRDFYRGRWTWPQSRHLILETLLAEPAVEVGVEAAGFQLAAWQDIMSHPISTQRVVRAIRVDRDKVSMAQPWIARAEAGKVHLVRGPWIDDFLFEVDNFPVGDHDDQIDVVSGVNRMANQILIPAVLPVGLPKAERWY